MPVQREQLREWLEGHVRQAAAGEQDDLLAAVGEICGAQYGWAAVENETEARRWLAYARAHHWQPVRILARQGRSRGFRHRLPDVLKVRDWCQRRIAAGWAIENRTAPLSMAEHAITFWFERPPDAAQFALKWMPMKCT